MYKQPITIINDSVDPKRIYFGNNISHIRLNNHFFNVLIKVVPNFNVHVNIRTKLKDITAIRLIIWITDIAFGINEAAYL